MIENERVGKPVVVTDIGRGLLPGLNKNVLLTEQFQTGLQLRWRIPGVIASDKTWQSRFRYLGRER